MKTIALLLTLFFLATSFGQQDSAPPAQSDVGKDSTQMPSEVSHFPRCHGDSSNSADCVVAPRRIYAPQPRFPRTELKKGRGGTVTVTLIVGTDGLPQNVNVNRSLSPAFDAAAVDAVKKWKFSPATYDGKPVKVPVEVEVEFHPRTITENPI
jgi:TonB family protein